MTFIKKHSRILAILLFGLLYFAFFNTANNILNDESKKISEKGKEEKVEDIKPADIDVTIDFGDIQQIYSFRMNNDDSILDLLEELREEYGVSYEQVFKTEHDEISEINGVKASDNKSWNIYDDEVQVIDYKSYKLDDNNHYYFKLEIDN